MEGSAEITQDIAERLSAALGMPAQFWLNLEKQFRTKGREDVKY